jgi:coenzyme PQQ precursor peptide PqqA
MVAPVVLLAPAAGPAYPSSSTRNIGRLAMAWTTPILVEICLGLEINGYLPAEF